MKDEYTLPLRPSFDRQFWKLHLGRLLDHPTEAIVELVTNGYDAGATRVDISWPSQVGEPYSVSDNGHGMTPEQFRDRWAKINYDRREHQGLVVEFPGDRKPDGVGVRHAFGQSGRGRHSAFCFSDSYTVRTWRDGKAIQCKVSVSVDSDRPFDFDFDQAESAKGHGTKIFDLMNLNICSSEELARTIGSKFFADPSFKVYINKELIDPIAIGSVSKHEIEIGNFGSITIHTLKSDDPDKRLNLKGITYWVNNRMVGQPSWEGLDQAGKILDGRSREARQFSFVVIADFLNELGVIAPEWKGFRGSPVVDTVQKEVVEFVTNELNSAMAESHKAKKINALRETAESLGEMSGVSRAFVGHFVEDVIQSCPSISQGDLSKVASVFAKMEETRSGTLLLAQLADCTPDELDEWSSIMSQWSARDASLVLSEIYRRIDLLKALEQVVRNIDADELHELHPIIEKGLWILGPQYDTVEYLSNREMATILREMFTVNVDRNENGMRTRPDIVARPNTGAHIVKADNSSLAVYSQDGYGEDHEVNHISSVLIVELKAPGVPVGLSEMNQAFGYAARLKDRGAISPNTKVVCYTLGGGNIVQTIEPLRHDPWFTAHVMELSSVVRRAHQRTFNILNRLKDYGIVEDVDLDVESVLHEAVHADEA